MGGAIGFGIGYFGKCASGVCPLTSNPIISTIIGALMGAMNFGKIKRSSLLNFTAIY